MMMREMGCEREREMECVCVRERWLREREMVERERWLRDG
jgi:hypothetical protein